MFCKEIGSLEKQRRLLSYPTADTIVSDSTKPKGRTPQYLAGRLTRRCRVQVLVFTNRGIFKTLFQRIGNIGATQKGRGIPLH